MGECKMCPRRCGADRENGKRGYCGESAGIRVARTSLHMWEEPCITGEHGSGTVFFSGCALKCIFCQNRTIAGSTVGKELTLEELADAFLRLQDKGAANISYDIRKNQDDLYYLDMDNLANLIDFVYIKTIFSPRKMF